MTFKGGSNGTKRGHAPQRARKWHKIDTFLDITRKQNNFYSYKFGLHYLLGQKQAKSDFFSEIGVPLGNSAPLKALSLDLPLMTFPLCVDFSSTKNRSSKAKAKTGLQVIRRVECCKNISLTFRCALMSMTTRLGLHNIIWYPSTTSGVSK